mgnify:CR=1 FL=1
MLFRSPYSMKILLENLLRREDDAGVKAEDIRALAAWQAAGTADKEISFMPARVLLQDFTGVPCVVDLAAMRDAIVSLGGNPDRVSQLRATLGPRFDILSGDDSLTLPFMSVGADGVISVASNVIPREVSHMVQAFRLGKLEPARRLHQKYYPVFKDLFIETNPIPVKAALAMMGVVHEEYRLPLVAMGSRNRARLEQTLRGCGVIEGETGRRSKEVA